MHRTRRLHRIAPPQRGTGVVTCCALGVGDAEGLGGRCVSFATSSSATGRIHTHTLTAFLMHVHTRVRASARALLYNCSRTLSLLVRPPTFSSTLHTRTCTRTRTHTRTHTHNHTLAQSLAHALASHSTTLAALGHANGINTSRVREQHQSRSHEWTRRAHDGASAVCSAATDELCATIVDRVLGADRPGPLWCVGCMLQTHVVLVLIRRETRCAHCAFTHAITRPLTKSLTRSLAPPPTRALPPSLPSLLTHTHSLIHVLVLQALSIGGRSLSTC
jgi:hypothetical protein